MKTKQKDFELEEYDGKAMNYDEEDLEEDEESKDIDYDEFNTPNDFDVDEDYEDEEVELSTNKNKKNRSSLSDNTVELLRTIFKWYGFFGIIVALILIATYVSRGNIAGLIIYIIILIASYIGGYVLMYTIDMHK